MIEAAEFAAKMQAILNGTASEVVAGSRPDFTLDKQSVIFDVRSPSLPYADTAMDAKAGVAVLPVMAEMGASGQYEAYPDVMMWSASANLTFMFPISAYSDILLFYEYMAKAMVGKMVYFGSASGRCICTLGQPTFGQMRYLESYQYDQVAASTARIFGKRVCLSREWASLTFPVYLSGAAGLGESGGMIYANQIKTVLSFVYGGVPYSEELLEISPSDASVVNTYEQQSPSASLQKGLSTNKSIGATHTVFVRMNAFWQKFRVLYYLGLLSDVSATIITTVYDGAGAAWSSSASSPMASSSLIKDVSFSHDPGKPLTCTFSVEPKATVGEA